MEKISKKILEATLEPYKRECRYLVEAEIDYPIGIGRFKIPNSFYAKEGISTGHFNATDMMICYNQLAYTFFADSLQKGLISEIGNSLKYSEEYQLKNSLITDMNNIKFHKPIDPKEFKGEIKLEKIIPKREDLIFFKTFFSFENGKVTGNIDLALLKH